MMTDKRAFLSVCFVSWDLSIASEGFQRQNYLIILQCFNALHPPW